MRSKGQLAAAKKLLKKPKGRLQEVDLSKVPAPDWMTRCYRNNRYTVMINDNAKMTNGVTAIKAMIQRHDDKPIPSHWSELQSIKNEIFGCFVTAIEYYPSVEHLEDEANIYWLWVFPEGILPIHNPRQNNGKYFLQSRAFSPIINNIRAAHCQLRFRRKPMNQEERKIVDQALEILSNEIKLTDALTSPQMVVDYLRLALEGEYREHFKVLFLNTKNCVIKSEILFSGGMNSAQIYPRVIAKEALTCDAVSIILSHNHPSGDCTPSMADKELTKRISAVMILVDVKVLDHIIIGKNESFSFAEKGLI